MAILASLLTIRVEVELSEYSFSYTDWNFNLSRAWIASLTAAESAALKEHLQIFCSAPTAARVEQIQAILTGLFPTELLSQIENTPPQGHLTILSDETRIPWEWVGRSGQSLAKHCSMARDLAGRPNTSPILDSVTIHCLLGDPLTFQAGVGEDVASAAEILRRSQAEVVTTISELHPGVLRDALHGRRFASVHLATPGIAPLQIGGQTLLAGDNVGQDRTGPRFVFLHTYLRQGDSATVAKSLLDPLAGWARHFFASGVEAVLANLWPGSPSCQRKFTRTFYSSLLEGKTLGQSLLDPRRALATRGSLMAHAYCLYGNPDLLLKDLRPMKVRESTTMPGGLSTDYQLRVTSGSEKGRVLPLFTAALQQRGLVIGSAGARRCDIELDADVFNQTAALNLRDQTLVLKNLSGQPEYVRVNGLPVRSDLALSGWETLQLGPVEMQLELTDSADLKGRQTQPELEAYCLEISDGEHVRTEWYDDELLTLGRGSGARIVFSDAAVSRTHAVLQQCGGILVLARLGANLVAVNGVGVEQTHHLSNGDLVQLSDQASFRVLRILNG